MCHMVISSHTWSAGSTWLDLRHPRRGDGRGRAQWGKTDSIRVIEALVQGGPIKLEEKDVTTSMRWRTEDPLAHSSELQS